MGQTTNLTGGGTVTRRNGKVVKTTGPGGSAAAGAEKQTKKQKYNAAFAPYIPLWEKATGNKLERGVSGNNVKAMEAWARNYQQRKKKKPEAGGIAAVASQAKGSD
jgi:hypothetical protein